MELPKISFCLPVYNQSEMVKDSIAEILKYPHNDIEIVVNDDYSTEDILKIVNNYNDSRIKYYSNEKNLGHDLNILQCFKNSKAPYCFLLRVRDRIIADGIPEILKRLDSNPNTSYLTGMALDENKSVRLSYNISHYDCGESTIEAHRHIYLHPSGSLYCIKMLDLDRIEKFLKEKCTDKYSFLIHSMIRLELALKGDFELIKETPIWQYTNTLTSKDIAVNSTKHNVSVYAPEYAIKRYINEMLWACEILPEIYTLKTYEWLFNRYLDACTWGFKRKNEDKNLQMHYNCEKSNFSLSKSRNDFYQKSNQLAESIIKNKDILIEFNNYCSKYFFYNKTYFKIRFYCAKILRHTFVYKIYNNHFIFRRDTSKHWNK